MPEQTQPPYVTATARFRAAMKNSGASGEKWREFKTSRAGQEVPPRAPPAGSAAPDADPSYTPLVKPSAKPIRKAKPKR